MRKRRENYGRRARVIFRSLEEMTAGAADEIVHSATRSPVLGEKRRMDTPTLPNFLDQIFNRGLL